MTRLLAPEDASALAEHLTESRAFLAPWDALRDDRYFTAEGQRTHIEEALRAYAMGTMAPFAILGDDGSAVGRININGITRGAFQSASIGYWVAKSHNGRGLATRAVAEIKEFAFGALDLHRLQAETLLHNTASQRVLKRNGFTPYGVAPQYLKIAGEWQDHVLFQVLNPEAV
ncbi:GNAT family protein [Nocardiopsis sp. RSe5-2]|uniref:GNAT family protein n=1 Tax=Nocardiopsis endophytica TaxID=3018445 RepID=A0ABT4TYE8_9ACTN|nr:GNAT family protein [Nocardiopsis endophytica]MDA2809713.1 GNAT family protein [Nocardiopsis endophytica]